MKFARTHNNALKANHDAQRYFESMPDDSAVAWTFYFLAFLCLSQVALIAIWINSGLKKKSFSSLVI
jgi:hypothetical protein